MKSAKLLKSIEQIADHFENKSGIAHEEWLQENEITIDELTDIFDTISLILRGFGKLSPKERKALVLLGGGIIDSLPK